MNVNELISRMTLEEKASLLSGKGNFTTKGVDRLGIPGLYLSDGPHGLRKQAGTADHLGLNASLPATCYPTAATMANSWDTALGEELGCYLGEECIAQRVNVLLGPGLNTKRSPLCGRAFEYFSEDPYLAGKMAAAYIRGIQSKGVSACPKHFAANSQELLRMSSDSVVDERTLRELYLTGFEIAVKEGLPKTIMSSYNQINGTYANENRALLQDTLRDQWGFDGMVVSDWGGSNDHVAGVAAGSHLEMPAAGAWTDQDLVDAVGEGRLSEELLDQRVAEYLNVALSVTIPDDAPTTFDTVAHHAFARKAAAQSVVLLKNDGALLPLKAGTAVAVIGDFAQKPRYQGAGSSVVNPTRLDCALDALRESGLTVTGYAQGFDRNGGENTALRDEALALAKGVGAVLLYLGLSESSECEGMDRAHMKLSANQLDLVDALVQVNPNVVVVLSAGSSVELPFTDRVPAMVHGYLGGQAGAGAMADVLTGKVNPSGKLAETYAMRYEDTPAFRYFPGTERTAEYREGLFVGYRYYTTAKVPVRFPFGFGLSYTTFSYADLKVSEREASFTVTNTGSLAGSEVVQLYVGKADSAVFRPARELKGFAKVFLQPGESKTVTIPLDDKAFRYFNVKTNSFQVEGGDYQIWAAASSADLRLSGTVTVAGTGVDSPYPREALSSYYSGKVSQVSDKEFETLLGRPIPASKWDRSQPLGRNDTIAQMSYAKSGLARFVCGRITAMRAKSDRKGVPDLNILSIYNMPFRGISKLMGPMVSLEMVDAILESVNGHFWRGIGHLLGAWRRKGKLTRTMAERLERAGKEN